MRLITKQAVEAFMAFKPFKKDNTIVEVHKDQYNTFVRGKLSKMYLHGNLIAKRYCIYSPSARARWWATMITNAGYITKTTKERLNGIPGVHIQQKGGVWYLNGEVMKYNDWHTIPLPTAY